MGGLISLIFWIAGLQKQVQTMQAMRQNAVNNAINTRDRAAAIINGVNALNSGKITDSHHTGQDFTINADKTGRNEEFFDPGSAVRTAAAAATTTKVLYNTYLADCFFKSDEPFTIYLYSVIMEHGESITSSDCIQTNIWSQIYEALDTVDNLDVRIIKTFESEYKQGGDSHPYQVKGPVDVTQAANLYATHFNKREMLEEATYNLWKIGILVVARPGAVIHCRRRSLTIEAQVPQSLPM